MCENLKCIGLIYTGVYQTSIGTEQGKVTGLMDMNTVIKKLKKDGKSSQLWDANPAMPSEDQNLKLGGGGKGNKLK